VPWRTTPLLSLSPYPSLGEADTTTGAYQLDPDAKVTANWHGRR